MSFLDRLGWRKNDDGQLRGQYASVEESEDLVSKEGRDLLSLQEQQRALLESHRRLTMWLRVTCVAFALVVVVLGTTMQYTREKPVATLIKTPVPASTAAPT